MALYLFVNKGLSMSAGKIAAQAAQAAVGAFLLSSYNLMEGLAVSSLAAIEWWHIGGHHATYVMEGRDSQHLRDIERYLRERGFRTFMMLDEGMTEIEAIQPTVLAVEIVDKNDEHVAATFSTFKLYRDTVRVTLEIDR